MAMGRFLALVPGSSSWVRERKVSVSTSTAGAGIALSRLVLRSVVIALPFLPGFSPGRTGKSVVLPRFSTFSRERKQSVNEQEKWRPRGQKRGSCCVTTAECRSNEPVRRVAVPKYNLLHFPSVEEIIARSLHLEYASVRKTRDPLPFEAESSCTLAKK